MISRRLLIAGVLLLAVASLGAKEYKVGYIDSDAVISKYEAAKDSSGRSWRLYSPQYKPLR